ncbi:MAG: methionyl-tRNA formyltransferase [Betaproteobacteria bacterium]
MRLVFAGTPAFAAAALQALVEGGFDIALVLTQPDRPAGRGLRDAPSAVKRAAVQYGLNILQPPTLRDEATLALLRETGAPVMVVAAYGLLLPQLVLDVFSKGCINIHASLLPRWRGAAPIQRAILAGDRETGVSIMHMEQGLDTGPVYLTRALPIFPDDSAASLHDRLARLGAQCIVEALPQIGRGALVAVSQPAAGITYAHKITKQEALIDWQLDASDVDRHVRAFNPTPGAFTMLGGTPVKIWRARVSARGQGVPGEILAHGPGGIDVACRKGALTVMELQKAGAKRLSAADFVRGFSPAAGECFGA